MRSWYTKPTPAMKSLIWVVGEILLVFILLSLPGNNFSNPHYWIDDLQIDKLVHMALFGSLALSFFVHFEGTNSKFLKSIRAKALTLIFCTLYGIGMEYYQKYFAPTRGFEVTDMLADAIGAILALPFFTIIRKKYLTSFSK
jgi:VanZ family protein